MTDPLLLTTDTVLDVADAYLDGLSATETGDPAALPLALTDLTRRLHGLTPEDQMRAVLLGAVQLAGDLVEHMAQRTGHDVDDVIVWTRTRLEQRRTQAGG